MGTHRDTFSVSRLPDRTWRAIMHGFKDMEFFGATAAEALSRAAEVTDNAAAAIDRFRDENPDQSR